jgi:putative thioredoxin
MSSTPTNPRGAVDLSALAERAKQAQAGGPPASGGRGASYVVEVTEENFEAEARKSLQHPVVVELYSPRVPQGQQMSDDLAQLASEEGGKFSVARVNIDTVPQLGSALAQAFGVQGVPALGGLLQGQPLGLTQGLLTKEQLKQVVDQLLKAAVANGIVGRAEPVGGAVDEDADEPDPRFAAADEALQRGDYAAAVAEFDKLLQANPRDAEAQAGKAQAALLARTADLNPQQVLADAGAPDAPIDLQLTAADAELATGRAEEGFARLIDLIKRTSGDDRDRVRVRLLELFETLGNADPRVQKARRDLMTALF